MNENVKDLYYNLMINLPELEEHFPEYVNLIRQIRLTYEQKSAPSDLGNGIVIQFSSNDLGCYDLADYLVPAFQDYVTILSERSKENSVQVIESLFNQLTNKYNLEYSDCSYYVRELDPLSQWFSKENEDVAKLRLQRELVQAVADSFLYLDDPGSFHGFLVKYRLGLQPGYLFRSCVILQFGYKIAPDQRLFSVMFGGRLESLLNGERAKSIGCLSLTDNLKNFFREQKLPFETQSLISLLDQVISHHLTSDKYWFKDKLTASSWTISTTYMEEDDFGYVSGFYNYSGWNKGEFSSLPNHSLIGPNKRIPVAGYLSNLYQEPYTRLDQLPSILARQINLSKIVENYVREFLGLPFVGEGQWISEIKLLRLVEKNTTFPVIHQWSPDWLGRQRLDVAIPELNIAFEYQGKQHYEAIDFFGGPNAFEKLKKLDRKKKRLCGNNGILLTEIPYNLSWDEISNLIFNTFKKVC